MKDIIPCGCKPENALNKQLWFGCGCPSIGFSSFKQPIKQWDENDINDNGTVIKDYYDPYGGVSVDWTSGVWAEKQGMELKQEAYNPDTFRFFKR